MRFVTAPNTKKNEINPVNWVLAPAGRNVYRPRSIPNSSPQRGERCIWAHVVRHLSPRWGFKRLLDTVFYIPVAPLAGLFSFKNFQLMSVTESLYCRLGRAIAKPNICVYLLGFAIALPIGVNLAVPNPVGAVSNQCRIPHAYSGPDLREYVSDNRFRERLGAVRKPHLPDLEDP